MYRNYLHSRSLCKCDSVQPVFWMIVLIQKCSKFPHPDFLIFVYRKKAFSKKQRFSGREAMLCSRRSIAFLKAKHRLIHSLTFHPLWKMQIWRSLEHFDNSGTQNKYRFKIFELRNISFAINKRIHNCRIISCFLQEFLF